MTLRTRVIAFALFAGACVAAATIVVLGAGADQASTGAARPGEPARAREAGSALPGGVRSLIFRNTRLDDEYGRVHVADASGGRQSTQLNCDRVAVARGRGICLETRQGIVTRYRARIFDARSFRSVHTLKLPGIPSRARVSPDGTRAAYTVFVSGDSYAASGGFSTRTAIVDVRTGRRLADLERLRVVRDGRPFRAIDFNFWGVTFESRDSNRFYATLGTGGATYLVRGDLAARRMEVIREGVECPSLSPDGTRVAFKQRISADAGTTRWRAAVLDLRSLRVRRLSGEGVDDQIAWLDDEHVMYGLPRAGDPAVSDVWVEPARGGSPARRLIRGAASPQVMD